MEAEIFNALLRLIDLGDEAALMEIQRQYGKQIKWVAYCMLNDWHYSRDVLNEVMVILWNKSRKFQNIKDADACIYDLARKASITFYRKYLKKIQCEVALDNVLEKEASRHLIHNDDYSHINFAEAISGLSEIEKEIIIKKLEYGYTHAQIAKDLNIPEGTVKWRFQEILKKLDEKMPDDEDSS